MRQVISAVVTVAVAEIVIAHGRHAKAITKAVTLPLRATVRVKERLGKIINTFCRPADTVAVSHVIVALGIVTLRIANTVANHSGLASGSAHSAIAFVECARSVIAPVVTLSISKPRIGACRCAHVVTVAAVKTASEHVARIVARAVV